MREGGSRGPPRHGLPDVLPYTSRKSARPLIYVGPVVAGSDSTPPLISLSTYSYAAFGLTIGSDIDLDGFHLLASPPERYDVSVRVGSPPESGDGDRRATAFAGGVLSACVAEGQEITVSPVDGVDPKYLSAVVTGELFSVLIRQRGLLVLHGSAVSKDGRAVGFIGDSGWGKSTLAASLVSRGWRLLTDDLLVIDGLRSDPSLRRPGASGTRAEASTRGRPPRVVPSHASMRLSEAAVATVDSASVRSGGRAHALTTKLRVDGSDVFSDRETPLRHIFVLDPRPSKDHRTVLLSAREAATQFIHHTRGQKLLYSARARVAHLGRCADLSRRVVASTLRRRDGLSELGELCDLVEFEGLGEPAGARRQTASL